MASHRCGVRFLAEGPKIRGHSSSRFIQERAVSTAASEDVKIPPESPKYIFVPRPPQLQQYVPQPRKGILPRPRRVFQRIKDKGSDSFLDAAAPEPDLPLKSIGEDPRLVYKAAQAASRRQNLREGLLALRERKRQEDGTAAALRKSKQREYQRKVHAPEREDERLTRPTLLQSSRPLSATVLPDPNHEERMAEKRRRHVELQGQKEDARLSALHTLYINSKDFIVNHANLQKKVSEEFDKPFYQNNQDRGIWDEEGYPEDLRWLVAQQATNNDQYTAALGKSKPGDYAMGQNTRLLERSQERAQRVAEELTGGKM